MSLSTTQYGYIVDPMVPFTDDKGKTIKNGYIRVFMAGTSTPVLTYRNYDGATNQEKIELDNSGRVMHNVIGSKGSLYKVVVYNILHSQENPLLTVDKIAVLGASINASGATIVTGLDSVTVQEENFLKATVEGTGVELALDPTEVTSEVSTTADAVTAAPDYVVPLLEKTGTEDSKKISLANLFKFALDWISRLATTITSFASGDFIAVSNTTDGARKMSKDKLLQITAQNTLAGNVVQAFDPTRDEDNKYIAGESVVYEGKTYTFKVDHYGAWVAADVYEDSVPNIAKRITLNDVAEQEKMLMEFFVKFPINVFEKSQSSRGFYGGDSGTFTPNSGYRVSEKILLEPRTLYTFPFSISALGDNYRIYLCDENKNIYGFIKGAYSDGKLTFVTGNEACYALFNMGTYSDNQFMVCKTAEYPVDHVDFDGYFSRILLKSENIRGNIPISLLGNVVDVSPNLYNKDAEGRIDNKFIYADGYYSSNGYYISSPIKVVGGVTYKANRSSSALGTNYTYAIVDENGDLVSVANGSDDSGNSNFIVFTPSASGFVRLNLGTSGNLQTFMCCEYSKFPETFVPFGTSLQNDIHFGTTQKQEFSLIAKGSNLIGKIISLNGDSICYGAGFRGGYGKIIADTFGMTYQNIAVGGATIQAETYYQDSSPRHWISRTINNMRSDADYAIVEGGVNDSISSSMGELSSGLTAALDDTTFYGAFESMLKQLLIRFPGKKVGYIAVHQVPGWNPLNTDVATSKFIAAKRCCDKWGVPFLDLSSCVPPFGNMPNSGDLYTNLKSVYTENADGWHPTELCYRLYYVEKIVEWMNRI